MINVCACRLLARRQAFTNQEPRTMSQELNQEFVLRSDGNFYRRTTVETILINQDAALSAIKAKPMFNISLFPHVFGLFDYEADEYEMYLANNIVGSGQPASHQCFVEARNFYFTGAGLHRVKPENEEEDTPYGLTIYRDRVTLNTTRFDIVFREELNIPPRWTPSVSGLRLFFMLSFRKGKNGCPERSTVPYVFVYDPISKQSYAPNLPNVFTRGDICAGDDFPCSVEQFDDIDNRDLLGLVKKQIKHLNTSTCNNDLRELDNERNYLKFNRDGSSVRTLENGVTSSDKGFFQQINNESIMEFTSWLNQQ